MQRLILVIDDEKPIVDILRFNLEKEGYKVIEALDGAEGLNLALTKEPDLILLDVMLPKMDGFEVCRKVREKSGVPILMLTAREEEVDKVLGLEMGADDYVVKPFSSKELVLRVRNILHRANNNTARVLIQYKDLCLDKVRHSASLNGQSLELTSAEFKLLAYLMERSGKVQDRYELQHVILGHSDTTQTRALDTHIKRLRRKLGSYADCVITERGVGYAFLPQEEDSIS